MGKQRKQYQAAFKSKVALEAIKGVRTVNEIATHYGVHPTQVALWKKQALEHLRDAFADGRKRHERAEAELQGELYQQIGQLKVELDWVKKKLDCSAEAKRRLIDPGHPQLSITR